MSDVVDAGVVSRNMDWIFARLIFRIPIFKLQSQTKIMLYIYVALSLVSIKERRP